MQDAHRRTPVEFAERNVDDAGGHGGAVAVVVTPCRRPGEVDPPALARLCTLLAHQRCDGLFVLGSSGQAALLDEPDRRALTVAAREGTPAATTLYTGVTGLGLNQTVRYTSWADEDGADVAVVMVPLMGKYSPAELRRYFWEVAERSPIPVAMYHHLRMPSPLDVETLGLLAGHPNVVAIKDTSVDLDRCRQLVRVTRDTGTAVLQGSEKLICASLDAGADGFITALAGVAPEWHVALLDAHRKGDQSGAGRWQGRIRELWELFGKVQKDESISNSAYMLKRLLQVRGWLVNPAPVMVGYEPSEELDRTIVEHAREAGLEEIEADFAEN